MDETKTFAQAAAQALIAAAASPAPSTTALPISSEVDHKRHFLATFRRWSIIFKRRDGDVQDDKWLVAEYYDSLRHLSEAGMDALTDRLKESCIFFPSIRECLEQTKAGRYEYGHPFRGGASGAQLRADPTRHIAALTKQIADQRDHDR